MIFPSKMNAKIRDKESMPFPLQQILVIGEIWEHFYKSNIVYYNRFAESHQHKNGSWTMRLVAAKVRHFTAL